MPLNMTVNKTNCEWLLYMGSQWLMKAAMDCYGLTVLAIQDC